MGPNLDVRSELGREEGRPKRTRKDAMNMGKEEEKEEEMTTRM